MLQFWDAPASVKQELGALFAQGLLRGPEDFGPLLMAQLAELSEGGAVAVLQRLGKRLSRPPAVHGVGAVAVALIGEGRLREQAR